MTSPTARYSARSGQEALDQIETQYFQNTDSYVLHLKAQKRHYGFRYDWKWHSTPNRHLEEFQFEFVFRFPIETKPEDLGDHIVEWLEQCESKAIDEAYNDLTISFLDTPQSLFLVYTPKELSQIAALDDQIAENLEEIGISKEDLQEEGGKLNEQVLVLKAEIEKLDSLEN